MRELPTLNPAVLEQIRALPTADGSGFVDRLVALYRRQAAERLERLHVAASGDDWTELHRIAHGWKTSAGQLGAVRLHAMLEDLDERAREGRPAGLDRSLADLAVEHQRLLEALETQP